MVTRLTVIMACLLGSAASGQIQVYDISVLSVSAESAGEVTLIHMGGGTFAWEVPGGQGRLTSSGKITYDGKTIGTWQWTGGWNPYIRCDFNAADLDPGMPTSYALTPQPNYITNPPGTEHDRASAEEHGRKLDWDVDALNPFEWIVAQTTVRGLAEGSIPTVSALLAPPPRMGALQCNRRQRLRSCVPEDIATGTIGRDVLASV